MGITRLTELWKIAVESPIANPGAISHAENNDLCDFHLLFGDSIRSVDCRRADQYSQPTVCPSLRAATLPVIFAGIDG
jgi:hypothetical protein